MSTLLYSLGRWSYRHSWRVLTAWLLLLALAGGGAILLGQGTDNAFKIPGTESQAGLEQLSRTFPQVSGTSAQIIVVSADGDRVDTDAYVDPISDAVSALGDLDGVLAVTDPFDGVVSGAVNDADTAALIRLQFDGQASDVSADTAAEMRTIADELQEALPAGAQTQLGGDLFSMSIPGVTLTEGIGVIIALFVLIITFRALVVALLPLATALLGVAFAIALIFASTAFASISSTTPLLALMLGLAVGIDYALFIVARHQDQVRAGMEPEESAAQATATAGSAVVFAGVTVLIALIGLSFANIPFLTTMGVAASVAVAIAVLVALTLTPALLGFVGGRVVGRSRRAARRSTQDVTAPVAPHATARPSRWIMMVTRHPVLVTVAVVVGLGIAAIPATQLALALPNGGMQPHASEARKSYDLVAEEFGPGFNGPLILTGTIVTSTDPLALMDDLADEIAQVPGVREIALSTPNEAADTGIIQVVPETAPDDPATAQLVRDLRELAPALADEYGIALTVTGFTAVAIDISDRLGGALLPFALFVVGLSFVLLMIVFRSIAVPLTAALGYLLSVAAAFGAVALVFEFGVGADLLHVTKVGPVISFMPIVLMGVLFGLAMDYQVFLVTRMREDFVHASRARGGRADRHTAIGAVRSGFTATARVVTAAALIMFAVFAAFVPEGDSSLKPIALGLAIGIAIDAFLVRMTLIPALMTLLGAKAWWIPQWLDRILPHFDIEGDAVRREVALVDWPEPDTTAAIVGEDIAVSLDGGRTLGTMPLFADASFRIQPGGTLLVSSSDDRAGRAFVMMAAGRLAPDAGTLKIDGHLVPGRAAWVRRHVGLALLAGADDPLSELRYALSGKARIVAIDGLDQLGGPARDQAAALLRDAAEDQPDLAIVVSALREGPALALLAEARRAGVTALSLHTAPASPLSALSTEVTA